MKKSILFFSLLFLLLGASPVRADEFLVTFWTRFGNTPIPPLTPERPAQGIIAEISGSFLWDTSTNTFSNPNITDNLGVLGLDDHYTQAVYVSFLGADNSYGLPAGTMAGFTWIDPINDIGIQFSPGDHAFLGQQIEPRAGTYSTGMWFLSGRFGIPPASDYLTTVSAVPEPMAMLLLLPGLLVVLRKPKR